MLQLSKSGFLVVSFEWMLVSRSYATKRVIVLPNGLRVRPLFSRL